MLTTPKRTGRPPKRGTQNTKTTLSIQLPAETKNLLIDLADGYDLSISEYLTLLIRRDAES